MPSEESGPTTKWVISWLLDGDDRGHDAVALEKEMRRLVMTGPYADQMLASNVARLRDRSDAERRDWEEVLRIRDEAD
jgi:hypothetical protein